MCIYMYICDLPVYIHIQMCTRMCIYMYVYYMCVRLSPITLTLLSLPTPLMCVHIQMHARFCIYTYTYVHMHSYICAHLCTYMYKYVHMCIYMYTYMRLPPHSTSSPLPPHAPPVCVYTNVCEYVYINV